MRSGSFTLVSEERSVLPALKTTLILYSFLMFSLTPEIYGINIMAEGVSFGSCLDG